MIDLSSATIVVTLVVSLAVLLQRPTRPARRAVIPQRDIERERREMRGAQNQNGTQIVILCTAHLHLLAIIELVVHTSFITSPVPAAPSALITHSGWTWRWESATAASRISSKKR